MKLFRQSLRALILTVIFSVGVCYAQLKPGEYYIVSADSNQVWDIDAKCTPETRECPLMLAAKSGKPSQDWRVVGHDNFVSVINISLDRIISATDEKVHMNSYFPTNTNNFKAVANSDGSFILYQGAFDPNENLYPTSKTLQPMGGGLHLAEKAGLPDKKQSWLFVPFGANSANSGGSSNPSNEAKIKELLQQQKDLKDKKDFDGALKVIRQALELDPNSDAAYAEMAGAYWSKKDYPVATTFAEKSTAINPNNELAWNLLGLIAKDQNDCVKAIPYFSKVIGIDAKANYALTNRGYCYQTLKKYDESIADFTKAIAINPNYDSPYWGRAYSYGEQNKHEEAVADYTINVKLNPSAVGYNNRGYQNYLLKNYDAAIADYRKALEIDSNYGYAKGNLDWILKNRPATETLANAPTTAEAAFNLGMEVYKKHDIDGAIAYFTKAVELDPKYMMAYGYRGLIYEEFKKDKEKARFNYQKTLELQPNYPDVSIRLGLIDRALGYYDEAIDVYTKMFPFIGSMKPENLSALYTFRGLNYTDQGSYDQAIADFQKAIELNARYADAYDALGTAYKRKNDYDKAIANYNKAVEIDPNFAKAYTNRGLAYFYKGDYAKALADHNKAIELDPKMSAAYNNRAAVYDAQNKPELEIADYKKAVELDPQNDAAKANLEIATSVLGDGTNSGSSADVRFINAAIRAANRAYETGAKMPTGELACRNLFNSYLMLNSAMERLSSLQNGIRFGSIAAPKVEGGNSLEGFASELARIKSLVFTTGTDMRCDFIRVVR